MSETYKKRCKNLNYVEHLLILVSTVTGCVSIKTCTITAWIKNYDSFIKKKKHDNIVLLGKDNLCTIEVPICFSK